MIVTKRKRWCSGHCNACFHYQWTTLYGMVVDALPWKPAIHKPRKETKFNSSRGLLPATLIDDRRPK